MAGTVDGSAASGTLEVSYWKVTFDPFTKKTGQVHCTKSVTWSAEA